MYIRIYVHESLAIVYIIHILYSYTLDLSLCMIIRSGACVQFGFSSAIYVYALVQSHNRRSLAVYSPTHMDLSICVCCGFVTRLYLDSFYMSDPDLYCYSLPYFVDYDPEDIWALVQRHEGSLSPQHGGNYEFYIPRQYASILVLAFPMLRRQYQKDLYT